MPATKRRSHRGRKQLSSLGPAWLVAAVVAPALVAACTGKIADVGGPGGEPGDPTAPRMDTIGPGGEDPGLPGSPNDPTGPDAPSPPGIAVGGDLDSKSLCEQLGDALSPGSSPIRRLNRREYNNTVRDLLGDQSRPASSFSPEEEALGFDNNADVLGVTALLAEQYSDAAASLAQSGDIERYLPCDVASGDDTCGREFIQSFGKEAFRRPLETGEVDRYFAVYEWGRDHGGFEEGVRMVTEAVLQSPHFLYRVEVGTEEIEPGVVKVTPYELASRLSYLFWGSKPDPELIQRVEAGELETADDVRREAERLLADDRARDTVLSFHDQWLELDGIAALDRSPDDYAGYSNQLKDSLVGSAHAFVESVVWQGAGDIRELFTAPYAYMNADLAQFYGVSGPTGSAFEQVQMPAGQYSGILTHGGLLAALSKPNQTSPVHRGKFVREQLLCQILEPPPDNIEIVPPELDPTLTTRQRFNQHSEEELCASCHRLTDQIGLGFEHYDQMGRWRDTENGLPIDATGEIVEADVAGPFDGAVELGAKLASSDQVATCVMKNWVRFAYGRSESPEDACTLEELKATFKASGNNIRDLLVAITQTDAFLYRKTVSE